MPLYTAIHLGFVGVDAISTALVALGVTSKDGGQPTGQDLVEDSECFTDATDAVKLDPLIQEAYMAVAARLGWTHVSTHGRYLDFQTPHGNRRTTAFRLSFDYDTSEAATNQRIAHSAST